MRDRIVVGIVVAIGVIGGVVLACNVPAQGQETLTGRCAEDPNATEFIDTSDISMFTGVFGLPSPELDIFPVLDPNGFVDTADIQRVTAHFGEQCWGTLGVEPDPPGMAPASVWGCTFEVAGFGVGAMGNNTLLGDWGGKSRCKNDGSGGFTSWCMFTFEKQLPSGGWTAVAVTQDGNSVPSDPTFCMAPGQTGWLPHYERLRGTLEHRISKNGQTVHYNSFHGSSYTFCVTVSPCQ